MRLTIIITCWSLSLQQRSSGVICWERNNGFPLTAKLQDAPIKLAFFPARPPPFVVLFVLNIIYTFHLNINQRTKERPRNEAIWKFSATIYLTKTFYIVILHCVHYILQYNYFTSHCVTLCSIKVTELYHYTTYHQDVTGYITLYSIPFHYITLHHHGLH